MPIGGIVDEDVYRAGNLEGAMNVARGCDIALNGNAITAGIANSSSCLLVSGVVPIETDDLCAFLRQAANNFLADACRAAGDRAVLPFICME